MPTLEEVQSDIKKILLALQNDTAGLYLEWKHFGPQEAKELDREINSIVGKLEILRSRAKLYAKLQSKN